MYENTTSTIGFSSAPSPQENVREAVIDGTVSFFLNLAINGIGNAVTGLLGVIANVINIIVFIRQGVNLNSASASLLGLAVADLVNVISTLWLGIAQIIDSIDPPDIPFHPWAVQYLLAGIPHLMCANIARVTTAYVAFERCICVVFPFKVKSLFTNRRTFFVIISIFIICGLCYVPLFSTQRLGNKLDPLTNRTILALVLTPDWKMTNDALIFATSIAFNQLPVIVVLLCTITTVVHLNLSKAWRESLSSTSTSSKKEAQPSQPEISNKSKPKCPSYDVKNSEKCSEQTKDKQQSKSKSANSKLQKEKKVVKMVVFISVVFLVSYIPNLLYVLLKLVYPTMRTMGNYHNLSRLMMSSTFLWESINSGINVFIYYSMSSMFKKEFRLLFRLKDPDELK